MPTLHDELREILRTHGNLWMTTRELADEVNARGRYRTKSGSPVTHVQVYNRAWIYTQLFEHERSRVRLKR
jgi:hypothetical protein